MQQSNVIPIKIQNSRPLVEQPFVAAYDDSGSMASQAYSRSLGTQRGDTTFGEILVLFHAMARSLFKFTGGLAWSDHVGVFDYNGILSTNGRFGLSFGGGGTNPSLLNDPAYKQHLDKASMLMFLTDGEIDANEIRRFKDGFKQQYGFVVCGIVGPEETTVDRINMSVVAPFTTGPHVALYITPINYYVISHSLPPSAGVELRPVNIARGSPMNGLEKLELTRLAKIQIGVPNPCPEGYLRVNNDYVDVSKLSQFTFDELQQLDFGALVLSMKMSGRLPELRAAVKRHSINVSHANPTDQRLASVLNASRDVGQDFLAKVRELRIHDVKQAMTEHAQHAELVAAAQRLARERMARVNSWLGQITEAESASYSAADLSKIRSNRVLRLDNVRVNKTEIDYHGAPTGECEVCLQTGSVCLLIIDPHSVCRENMYNILDDYMVTFPLEYPGMIISPLVYCPDCAQTLLGNGVDGYRNPVVGMLPVTDFARNFASINYQIMHALACDKQAYHIWKVVYASIVQSMMREWAGRGDMKTCLEYITDQILTHTKDRIGMVEGGAIRSLGEVIDSMASVNNIENFLRQPFRASLVILYTMLRGRNIPSEILSTLVVKAFCRGVLTVYNSYLNNASNFTLKRDIRRDLFDHPHGIPVLESAHLTTFDTSRTLKAVFRFDVANPLNPYSQLKYLLGKIGVAIGPHAVTTLLAAVYSIRQHDKFETVLNHLLTTNEKFVRVYNNQVDDTDLIPELKKLFGEMRVITAPHDEAIPPFITCLGPSRIRCSCGFKFDHDELDRLIDGYDYVARTTQRRIAHFEDIYGSFHPSPTSGHCNLHEATKHVMRNYFPTATAVTRAMIIRVMANLWGRKGQGNIYQAGLVRDVFWAVRSWIQARDRFPDVNMNMDKPSREYLIDYEHAHALPHHYILDNSAPDPALIAPFTEAELAQFDAGGAEA